MGTGLNDVAGDRKQNVNVHCLKRLVLTTFVSATACRYLLSWTVDSGVVGAPHSLNHCCRGQWTVEWWEHHTVSTTAVVDSGQWSGGSTTQSQTLLSWTVEWW